MLSVSLVVVNGTVSTDSQDTPDLLPPPSSPPVTSRTETSGSRSGPGPTRSRRDHRRGLTFLGVFCGEVQKKVVVPGATRTTVGPGSQPLPPQT